MILDEKTYLFDGCLSTLQYFSSVSAVKPSSYYRGSKNSTWSVFIVPGLIRKPLKVFRCISSSRTAWRRYSGFDVSNDSGTRQMAIVIFHESYPYRIVERTLLVLLKKIVLLSRCLEGTKPTTPWRALDWFLTLFLHQWSSWS